MKILHELFVTFNNISSYYENIYIPCKKISAVSAKTCIFSNFLIYVKNKNEIADESRKHYTLTFIRKMNLILISFLSLIHKKVVQ